jgi:hypothetical protein
VCIVEYSNYDGTRVTTQCPFHKPTCVVCKAAITHANAGSCLGCGNVVCFVAEKHGCDCCGESWCDDCLVDCAHCDFRCCNEEMCERVGEICKGDDEASDGDYCIIDCPACYEPLCENCVEAGYECTRPVT